MSSLLAILVLIFHANFIIGSSYFTESKESSELPQHQIGAIPNPKVHKPSSQEPRAKSEQSEDNANKSFSGSKVDHGMEIFQSASERRLLEDIPVVQNFCHAFKHLYALSSRRHNHEGPLNLFEFQKEEVNLDCGFLPQEIPGYGRDPLRSEEGKEATAHSIESEREREEFLRFQIVRISYATVVYFRNCSQIVQIPTLLKEKFPFLKDE